MMNCHEVDSVLRRNSFRKERIPRKNSFFENGDWNCIFLKQKNDEVEITPTFEKRKYLFILLIIHKSF